MKYIAIVLLYFASINIATASVFQNKSNTPNSALFTAIKDPNERAVRWLLEARKLQSLKPYLLKQFIEESKNLWNDNYPYKNIVIELGEIEDGLSVSTYEADLAKSTRIINTLSSIKNPSIYEKQLTSLAYLASITSGKYTKELPNALERGFKAIEIAKNSNFPFVEASAHNQIAILIQYILQDTKLALEHLNKAELLLPKIPAFIKTYIKRALLGNRALFLMKLNQLEKSIEINIALLELNNNSEESHIQSSMAVANNIGNAYMELKQFDNAEIYLKKSLAYMNEAKVYSHKGIPLSKLINVYVEKGDIEKAEIFVDSITTWLNGDFRLVGEHEINYYQFMSNLAKAKNDWELAIQWMEKAVDTEKKNNEKLSASNIVNQESKHSLRITEQDLQLLKNERELDKVTIRNQTIGLLVTAIICILSLLFSLIVLNQKRETEQAYDYILTINKENLSKDIHTAIPAHHNVKEEKEKKIDTELKEKIIRQLTEEKLYLERGLTLKTFSDLLDSNTSYVSKTINDGFDKNFSTLINEYRIKEVLRMFEAGEHKAFTIESIYKKAGFNSKSSFQKAFKAYTGVTASHYLMRLTA